MSVRALPEHALGLIAGSELYPEARRAYFNNFRKLLFGQTQGSLLNSLQRLPASPSPQDEYGPAYDTLKAYLITTSHHGYSTRAFLAPVLMRHWTAGRTVDPQRSQLAQTQFEFYANELKEANPYGSENDGSAIERGRRYLAQFAGTERVYQNMLADAGRTIRRSSSTASSPVRLRWWWTHARFPARSPREAGAL